MNKLRLLKYLIPALVLVPVALVLHFYLPRSVIVDLTSTEVRRVDQGTDLIGQTDRPNGTTRDVYFVFTSYPGTSETFVLRNEDTGWGFPFYFKFDSADINAKASSIADNPDSTLAKVRYYGFRIQLFSMFPNVLSIEKATLDTSTFPWFRVVFIGSFALLGFYAWFLVGRLKRRVGGA